MNYRKQRIFFFIELIAIIIRTGFVFFRMIHYGTTPGQENSPFVTLDSISQRWSSLWTRSDTPSSGDQQTQLQDALNTSDITSSGDQQLISNDRMSLNDIINTVDNSATSGTFVSTQQLAQQYHTSKDPNVGIQYITKLTKEFNYSQAYKEIQDFDSMTLKKMNPHLVLRIFFNSELIAKKTQNLTIIENLIGEFSTKKLITSNETQWYKALLTLIRWDTKNFILNLPIFDKTSDSELKSTIDDIRIKAKQSTQGQDIPPYYTDGVIALSLFQHGYPFVAQQLSLAIVEQHPNYILPQQILAYSNMTLHQWSQAQSYFLQLITQDSKNITTYQFFAGVCSYWLGKYTDAILYLNQIPVNAIISDIIRYKILSYIALEDWTNTAKQMKNLLTQNDISNADMMLIRENTVFKPYMMGWSYAIIAKDSSILDLYIERCATQHNDPLICEIGKLAKDVQLNLNSYSDSYLKTLIAKFPRSYLYYILGDYYIKKGNKTEAQKAYVSALSLSTDEIIKKKITAKIKGLL